MRRSSSWFGPLLVLFLIALATPPIAASEWGPAKRLEDATCGELLLATEVEGAYLAAPTLETEVELQVAGLVGRNRVRQRFSNPTESWVEGVYVFPLPDTAAVDRLELVIGDRVIVGQIEEKEEAEARYREAAQSGQRASLLTQKRPNLFTTAVANIAPGETVEVVIEFQDEVRYDSGVFSLRFPLVVAPRYRGSSVGSSGAIEPTPDPPRISGQGERSNRVRVTAVIDAGLPLARISSSSHEIEVTPDDATRYQVELATGSMVADRDLLLTWEPEVGQAPVASLFLEDTDDATYALLMMLPPVEAAATTQLSRTVLFVLDTSASMAGASIRQAKRALVWAIDRLEPTDRFNVIRFSSYAERLFPAALPADEETKSHAADYVRALTPRGGTEMITALSAALDRPDAREGLTQVVFITDGEVDNEAELFEFIQHSLGTSRLFTVGIGSAPNAHSMRKAAQHGRGTFTFIARPSEVEDRMSRLFAKLESPVLSDLEVDWSPGEPAAYDVEAWPQRIGDLYLGEPLVVAARLPRQSRSVTVDARFDHQAFRVTAEGTARSNGIAALWARRKIAALLDREPNRTAPEIRKEVVEVALEHGLVSRFTSLVAIDETPPVRSGPAPEPRLLPVHLPAGWASSGGPTVLPRGATPAAYRMLVGLASLATAALLAGGSWRRARRRRTLQ